MLTITITVSIIYFVIFICIPVLVGVYVYRDARSRGMNAILWTLLAVLTPVLIGFIIFLLVRGSYSNMKCPKCDTTVTEQYVSCPNCGIKLKATCPSCSSPVEAEWKVCPICTSPLPEHYNDIFQPVKKKDNMLKKILIAVTLIPILLIIIMILSFSKFKPTSRATGVTSLPVDEYLKELDNEHINNWFEASGESLDTAYVLRHESTSGDQVKVLYLIYLPCLAENHQVSIGSSADLFGHTLKLQFTDDNGNAGNTLILATCIGEQKLSIYYDGQKVDCEITEVDYSLALTNVE